MTSQPSTNSPHTRRGVVLTIAVAIIGAAIVGAVALTTASNSDHVALAALYHATDGDNWHNNDNWLTDAPITEWYGVTADEDRVIALSLNSNALDGNLPNEIGDLSWLVSLSAAQNDLTGTLPDNLGSLDNLKDLDLHGNRLTGEIPTQLGNLNRLELLSLSRNQLTGQIPSQLGNLSTSLTHFDLHDNHLSDAIPSQLGDLSNSPSPLAQPEPANRLPYPLNSATSPAT